jgi:hypothetical protein
MSAVRTLTALGAALGQSIPELARSAADHVTMPSLMGNTQIEPALEVLLDRLCLSLTLAKPVGLSTWAQRETPRLGRAAVVDLTGAATHTIALAAGAYETDQRRLLAFLDVLANEIERSALGSDGEEIPDSPGTEGTTALLALLHDIGKISTPDHVLLKPAPLELDEWDIMRDHAAAGARILSQIPSLQRCAIIVRAHHERYDGAGYPDGIFGSSIPFEARVVAVADAFHAMISERPYRQPIAPRQALQVLQDGRGSQWDPDVIDAMLGMFTRRVAIVSHAHTHLSSA